MTVALQAPMSTGFPRQEYWSGLPFPSSGDLTGVGSLPLSHQVHNHLNEKMRRPEGRNEEETSLI